MKTLAQRFFNKTSEPDYISGTGTDVTILFSSENPSLLGRTTNTRALELSKKSIRLAVKHPIEMDSVLDISVKFKDSERSYNLTGNVRWTMFMNPNEYHIVLVLRERNDIRSDLRAWKDNFEQNINFANAI